MTTPLIAFRQEAAARLLVSHLQTHNIASEYRLGHNQEGTQAEHQVLILSVDDVEVAKQLTNTFLQNPNAPKYQQDAWQSGEQASQPINLGLSNFNLRGYAEAPFTLIILAFCLVVFMASVLGMFPIVQQWLFIQPLEQLLSNHQWWRLFTPDFIHFSPIHLIFNLLWWLVLGAKIERILGLSTLLIVFVVSSVAANVGQLLVSGVNFGGLSGVVYALIGFVWWLGWLRPEWNISLPKPIIVFLLVWLVVGYADVLWISMANTAHTLGLVSGCSLAFLYSRMSKKSSSV